MAPEIAIRLRIAGKPASTEPPGVEPPGVEPPGVEPPGVEPPGAEPLDPEPLDPEPLDSEPSGAERLGLVDTLKAVASQLIVLHHLAFYGPMSDAAAPLAPAVTAWFGQYGRYAVQAFLVLGGFLAARTLAPGGVLRAGSVARRIGLRYLRLAPPFAASVLLAVALSALARTLMQHDAIPAPPTWLQALAHLLLLHDLLDYPALSAGVWYVAIDFQLYASLALLLWLANAPRWSARSRATAGMCLVAAMALASLFHFNRDARWDEWAPYFFASYAAGAFACWASRRPRAWPGLSLLALAGTLGLVVDFRARIAVALVVALALGVSLAGGRTPWRAPAAIAWLARIGYSVFLVHFPVLLVVAALVHRFGGADPLLNALGIGSAWLASLAAGALFHRYVERRAWRPARWRAAGGPPREGVEPAAT